MTTKIESLANWLDIDVSDIEESSDTDIFETIDGDVYMILDDDEADQRVADNIRDNLRMFNSGFIADHIASDIDADMISKMRGDMQNFDTIVERLIDDIDEFVHDAICEDGRGHFLSMYVGEEIESGDFYIYRM